jgi:Tat protein secretion system quality control protein TatD with DNase activity
LRGKRNEPAFMRKTAEYVADLFGLTTEEVEARTYANTCEFFGI